MFTNSQGQFDLTSALKVQAHQLKEWKSVLNTKTYSLLKAECEKRNKETTEPYNVFRGTDMSCFVGNIAIRNTSKK